MIVPFATLDRDAARIARDNAVITLDFRDVLSFAALNEREWPPETIADLEARAAKLNGWRPPTDESSSVVEFGPPRRTRAQASLRAAAELASPPRGGRRRR